ncbi:MAG: hypothetical protein ACREA0_16250 [bacterium]
MNVLSFFPDANELAEGLELGAGDRHQAPVELRAGALHPNPTARDQRSAAGARKELGEAEQFVIFIDRRGRCGVIAR